jgi:hypothetical protein
VAKRPRERSPTLNQPLTLCFATFALPYGGGSHRKREAILASGCAGRLGQREREPTRRVSGVRHAVLPVPAVLHRRPAATLAVWVRANSRRGETELIGGERDYLSLPSNLASSISPLSHLLHLPSSCSRPLNEITRFFNGNTVRNFPTHGQLSAAQGSPTSCLNFDFAILNLLDPSAL